MGKLNEGDIIEGIFSIALCLYIADGKIEKKKLNTIRTKVDTKAFGTGRYKYKVAENVKKSLPGKPVDFFNVLLELRLKPKSIGNAFGENFETLYKRSKDVGDIDKKINNLINYVDKASFARKVDAAINGFLKNNKSEIVDFVIVSDGIEGESSGGEIKGDITLSIYAHTKTQKKKILSEKIAFSLKSESKTVASLSPYNGMLDIAKTFGVKWNAEKKYSQLKKVAKSATEKETRFALIEEMYSELIKKIEEKNRSPGFSRNAFDFLEKSIFGKDLADVVDIGSSGVKEISKEYFEQLKKSTKLKVEKSGQAPNLVFISRESNQPIFQLRTKLRRPPANEAKFYIEIAKGVYNK